MPQARILRSALFLILFAIGILQLRFAYQQQLVFSMPTGQLNTESLKDAYKLTYLAKQKHLFNADLEGATALLQQTLLTNPLYIPGWLALAEVYYDQGDTTGSIQILNYTDELLTGLKRWRWEKTLTAYQLGMSEELPGELRFIIHEIPGKNRSDALKLAFTLWREPKELFENIGTENVLALLKYAIRAREPDKALFFWEVIEQNRIEIDTAEILRLIDMLMYSERVAKAAHIWRVHFNQDTLLYNGDFSSNFLKIAFGWRKSNSKGFVYRFEPSGIDDDSRVLHYRFKGWENLNFAHLYQVVPIESPGRYELSADFKSTKLTTDQRPYLEVLGFRCNSPLSKTEMVKPDQDWTKEKISFEVPEDCSAITVRLRRKESFQIDSKLSGKLWLRNVAIVEVRKES